MSQDTTLTPLPDERAEFEAWADSRQYDLAQYLTLAQPYVDCDTQAAWTAWQARAAIAAQAPQPSPLIAVGEDGEGQENHCPECGAEPGQMCSDEEGTEHGRKVHAVRQAQQAQGVPAPDLIAAAQAVVRDALDAVEVHPCDVNDDSVRAKFLLGSMAALHSALAAAPQQQAQGVPSATEQLIHHPYTPRKAEFEGFFLSMCERPLSIHEIARRCWKKAAAPQAEPQPDKLAISPLEEQQLFDDWCPYKGNPDPRVVWAAAIDAANGMLAGIGTKGGDK